MALVEQGFITDSGFDPAEDHIGPFYYKETEAGKYQFAFEIEPRHCNGHGTVHGGVLMTFADFCLCMQSIGNYEEEGCVTVNLQCDFVGAVEPGSAVMCTVDVTRKTGSMVFARGQIYSEATGPDDIAVSFSGIVKRIRK